MAQVLQTTLPSSFTIQGIALRSLHYLIQFALAFMSLYRLSVPIPSAEITGSQDTRPINIVNRHLYPDNTPISAEVPKFEKKQPVHG